MYQFQLRYFKYVNSLRVGSTIQAVFSQGNYGIRSRTEADARLGSLAQYSII